MYNRSAFNKLRALKMMLETIRFHPCAIFIKKTMIFPENEVKSHAVVCCVNMACNLCQFWVEILSIYFINLILYSTFILRKVSLKIFT